MREGGGGRNVKLSGLSLGDLAATPDINLQSSSGGNRALICLSAPHLPYRSSARLPVLFSSLLAPADTAAAAAAAASSFDIFHNAHIAGRDADLAEAIIPSLAAYL